MTNRTRLARGAGLASLCAAAVAAASWAGPTKQGPLKFANGAVPEGEQAFFYEGGRKVPLRDTGMAVVKFRPGVTPANANLPLRPLALTPDSGLRELAPRLEKEGLVLVGTHGPAGLNLANPGEAVEQKVAYSLPVVERADQPAGRAAPLVMTPQVTVRFARGVKPGEAEALLKEFGLKGRKQEYTPDAYVAELAEGKVTYTRLLEAANRLAEKGKEGGKVVYSLPDFLVPTKRHRPPADPLLGGQWHLKNTGQGNGKPGADVSADKAWAVTTGRPEVRIAVIDDSVQRDHPDLQANFVAGLYFKPDGTTSGDPSPKDPYQEHGTACAGVAAAAANTKGGCGVAPGCGLIGVNFWDAQQPSQVAEAFYFCDANKAAVVSCSWSWNYAFDAVAYAIQDLAQNGRGGKGVVILFAAGNDYGQVAVSQKFGTLKEVICVGATNWQDDHSAYSNSGPEVSVVAPSSDYHDTPGACGILTTDNTDDMPKNPGEAFSGYTAGDYTPGTHHPAGFGGTSSATPLAAGVCGLILSVKPDLTAKQVREILESTADKIPGGPRRPASYDAKGHDLYYGYGRVNAHAAVLKAKSCP